MNGPVVIVISANLAVAVALACIVLVTVLAVIDHRRRGRLMKRQLSELEAVRECRDVVDDYIRTVHKETP